MNHEDSTTRIDLQEVTTRNRAARRIINGFATSTPALAEIWRQISAALADIAALLGELKKSRLARANLAAAGRATIAAADDGESDPLAYLRDELHAQGDTDEPGWRE